MSVSVASVSAGGMSMSYFRFGIPGAQPMAVLPGLSIKPVSDSVDAVAAGFRLFAEAFDVYVLDRRDNMPPDYDIFAMAADTAVALDTLGLRDVCLLGVSQGGMIAQTIAVQRPDLVKKLALCSTAAALPTQTKALIGTWVRYAAEGDTDALMLSFGENVYSPAFFAQYKDALLRLGKLVTSEELHRFGILANGTQTFDLTAQLAAVRCPALVIGAGRDRVFGAAPAKELASLLGAQLFIYETGSHAVYDEAPDFRARVLAFWNGA